MIYRLAILVAMTLTIAETARASPIVIQEVLYDASGPDAPLVFTELLGPAGMSLDGWSLVGINGSNGEAYRFVDLTGGVVPPDGLFLVATAAAALEIASVRDFVGSVDWQNGPDAVQLWDPLGTVIDALQYGDAGDGNAGEGRPATDAVPGLSLSRDARGGDTGDNAVDFLAGSPTPGWVAAAPMPAPATWGLVALGLVALISRRSAPG